MGANGERAAERRRQILDAAATVFARRGYHQARTREIAAEARVSEGLLYRYFEGKRHLLLALVERLTTEAVPEALAGGSADDPRSLLTSLLRDRLAMLERNRALVKVVLPELISDEDLQREYFERVILPFAAGLEPVAKGILRSPRLRPFNHRAVLPAMVGAVVGAFFLNDCPYLPPGGLESREELVDELAAFLLDGLREHRDSGAPPWAGDES